MVDVNVVVGVTGVDVAALEAASAKKASGDDDKEMRRWQSLKMMMLKSMQSEPSRTRCGHSCARTRRMSGA
jgi:hypothetical protein